MSELAFGAMLRHLRHAAGLSLRGLAKEIGVSPAYLSQVEMGKEAVPAPTRLLQIEAALRLQRGELLALAQRIDPRVSLLLREQPAATELLLAAADAGFTAADYRGLAAHVRCNGDGPAAPWRQPSIRNGGHDTAREGRELRPYLTPARCAAQLAVANRTALFRVLADRLAADSPALDPQVVVALLDEREEEASTAVGAGIAIPHARLAACTETMVAVATLRDAIIFDEAHRNQPVSLVFLVLSPAPPSPQHVHMLARIARLCHDPAVCKSLIAARNAEALYGRLCMFDRQVI